MSSAEMTPAENAIPTPTRAQAEQEVAAMLDVSNTRGNLATQLKVADYATWRARFDGMEEARASTGITNVKVFRHADNENALVILADIADLAGALAWARGGWRTAIPAAGLEGPPIVYFGTAPVQEQPLKCMGHFKVADYAKWHGLFLKMENSRAAGGLTNADIFRGSEEENDLLVLGDIADAAKARAWLIADQMTGYPAAATVPGSTTFRFAVELGPGTGKGGSIKAR